MGLRIKDCRRPGCLMGDNDKLYFPVPRVRLQDLLDWKDTDQIGLRLLVHTIHKNELKQTSESKLIHNLMYNKCFGNKVTINDEEIALFRVGTEVFAVQAKCPHAGGPLYLGDIEELATSQICVRCPWHKWEFDVKTGQCLLPGGREIAAQTYPARVKADGQIFIGFDSFGPSAFFDTDW